MTALYRKRGRLSGDELRQLRAMCGVSQRELAQWFQVRPLTITRWESDRSSVPRSAELLYRVLAAEAVRHPVGVVKISSLMGDANA